jgi:hypothetical protein
MDLAHPAKMFLQRSLHSLGQHCPPILDPLSIPHGDLPGRHVHVLHPQPEALQKPQPRAVHQAGHQPPVPV